MEARWPSGFPHCLRSEKCHSILGYFRAQRVFHTHEPTFHPGSFHERRADWLAFLWSANVLGLAVGLESSKSRPGWQSTSHVPPTFRAVRAMQLLDVNQRTQPPTKKCQRCAVFSMAVGSLASRSISSSCERSNQVPLTTPPWIFFVFAISANGSASSKTKLAENPTSIRPQSFDNPSIRAGFVVAVSRACIGVRPALVGDPSSSCRLKPGYVKGILMSVPARIPTPSLCARAISSRSFAYSRFRIVI